MNQSVERAIAGNRRAPDNGTEGKCNKQIHVHAAENGNPAALRDSRPRMTSEKAPCDYSRSATGYVQESRGGCGQTEHVQTYLLNSHSTLKPGIAIILLRI